LVDGFVVVVAILGSWVVLGKSDIVPADLAAQSLRSSPKTIPTWARWVIGGVLHTVVPFYERARYVEDETARNVETAAEVVEQIAEVTEKLASNVADHLPENGCLQKVVEKIEYIAEVVDEDAEKVEAITEKVGSMSLPVLPTIFYIGYIMSFEFQNILKAN
ncbi:Os08g0483600, partial [Oryza sativa Japonica Group]